MKIRHTKGPGEIELGKVKFRIGEAQEVDDAMAAQALLPQRVAEYGFEEVNVQTPAPRVASKKTDTPTDMKE